MGSQERISIEWATGNANTETQFMRITIREVGNSTSIEIS
jgi:hypothetical protein